MMGVREIGSEFWDVPITNQKNNLFPKSTQWFLSGRSALQAIVKELKGYHTVAMPSWCCDSIIRPFVNAGLAVYFYPVYYKNRIIQEISLDSDVLFIMDYFGYESETPDLSGYKGVVICDVTHSIFLPSYSCADYYFGSFRKWCGFWTGGYAWTGDGHQLKILDFDNPGYIELRKQAMKFKASYISNGAVQDKSYLKIYEKAENLLENTGIAPASERDVSLAQMLDIDYVISRRRANAKILMEAFSDLVIFPELKDKACPIFVPILVSSGKRDELRQYLIKNKIYCPVHWPVSIYHKLDEKEKFIYDNELSLVCDQRYSEEDMNYMVEIIRKFQEV